MNEVVPASNTVPAQRHLPALALPKSREDRRASAVFSVLVHALVIMLLVTPFAVSREIIEQPQGAGGPGPTGGGGGGRRGTGGESQEPKERLHFVSVSQQQSPARVEPPKPVPVPAVVTPPPKPVVQEKQPDPIPAPTPEPSKPVPDVSMVTGSGGGSGNDGSKGSGPGSGGGVGSGVGTGRGTGVGPGTGGGTQADYPPTVTELFIPPMPVPQRVRGTHIVAEFDVDSVGRVVSFDFTQTRDGDYNKKLREVFRSFKFKPGVRGTDGTPIRMKAQVAFDLP